MKAHHIACNSPGWVNWTRLKLSMVPSEVSSCLQYLFNTNMLIEAYIHTYTYTYTKTQLFLITKGLSFCTLCANLRHVIPGLLTHDNITMHMTEVHVCMRHGPWLSQGLIHDPIMARRRGSTDLGRFRVFSLGLPSATSGPGGGCEASTGETTALLFSFFDSLLPDLSFFSGLSGLSGFAVDSFAPASSMLELLGLSPLVFAGGKLRH